jgi:hypothetical protein
MSSSRFFGPRRFSNPLDIFGVAVDIFQIILDNCQVPLDILAIAKDEYP